MDKHFIQTSLLGHMYIRKKHNLSVIVEGVGIQKSLLLFICGHPVGSYLLLYTSFLSRSERDADGRVCIYSRQTVCRFLCGHFGNVMIVLLTDQIARSG